MGNNIVYKYHVHEKVQMFYRSRLYSISFPFFKLSDVIDARDSYGNFFYLQGFVHKLDRNRTLENSNEFYVAGYCIIFDNVYFFNSSIHMECMSHYKKSMNQVHLLMFILRVSMAKFESYAKL